MAEIVGDSPDSEPTRRDLSEARYPEVNPAFIGRSENCWERVTVQVAEVKQSLLAEEDLDLDDRLTIEDLRRAQGIRGDGHFVIPTTDGQTVAISGLYQLANILQELAIAEEEGRTTVTLEQARIEEPVVDRTSRMIRERFWKNLTRRIDAASLLDVLQDEKIDTAENHFLFVPESDPVALRYFREVAENDPSLRLEVISFPRHASAGFMQKLGRKHGLVSLALEEGEDGTFQGVPFVVPGGRFNEMYGWDSYFISLGLLEDGKADLAKSMTDNFIYQLTHYGKILNANRSYYFNRSQPPFTSSLILEVYEALPRSPENLAWLQRGLEAAMNEYHEVWMAAPRLGSTGLSHYGGESVGEPIETEEGHFDWLYDELAAERGISVDELREQYAKGTLVVPELDNFFRHDCAVRESGHDTTSRWRVDGVDRCADFAPVDLNSLLYKTENVRGELPRSLGAKK